jgi:hypothetical protein
MRPRRVLLVLAPTVATAFLAASAAAGAPPGASYPWAQPDTALPTAVCAQPPATVPIVPVTATAPIPGCSYAWAQPGTAAALQDEAQPPAFVPVAAARSVP